MRPPVYLSSSSSSFFSSLSACRSRNKPTRIWLLRGSFGKLFRWAMEKDDLRLDNPVTTLRVKRAGEWKIEGEEIDPLTAEELHDLIGWMDERRRNIVAVAGYSGPRISEALGLLWEDVNFDETNYGTNAWRPRIFYRRTLDGRTGELRLGTKTSKKGREIDMHPALYPFLKAQQKLCGLNRRPTDYVFPGIGRERLNGKLGEWAELRGRSGRKGYMDFTFHHLRHTYVSRLLVDSAIPIAHVAHQIGDKIQTVYETYADLIQRRESGIHVAAHARTFR